MNNDIEKRLWAAADQLWANSDLRPSEFSTPVLGLIFLRDADHKFTQVDMALAKRAKASQGRRRIGKTDYQAEVLLYVPHSPRFSSLHRNVYEQACERAYLHVYDTYHSEKRSLYAAPPPRAPYGP